jgi:hypothetical protein
VKATQMNIGRNFLMLAWSLKDTESWRVVGWEVDQFKRQATVPRMVVEWVWYALERLPDCSGDCIGMGVLHV